MADGTSEPKLDAANAGLLRYMLTSAAEQQAHGMIQRESARAVPAAAALRQ
jgi:hypothetical protein